MVVAIDFQMVRTEQITKQIKAGSCVRARSLELLAVVTKTNNSSEMNSSQKIQDFATKIINIMYLLLCTFDMEIRSRCHSVDVFTPRLLYTRQLLYSYLSAV